MDAFDMYRGWWADVPSRLGTSTCRIYRREIFAALADLGKHPRSVSTRDLEKHLGTLRPQHASLRRAALMDFFSTCVRKGYRPDNPLADLAKTKVAKTKVRRGMSHDELWRTVFAALWMGEGKQRGNGYRLAYAILAQYGLLLRPSEFLLLSKDRIVLNGTSSCVYLTNTKTGNDRVVPVVGVAREALEKLVEMSGPDSSRIMSIGTERYWEKVRQAAMLAGVPPEKCRPYALRHTGATHLAEAGVPPRVIAEILGHRDLRHVLVYTAPSNDELRTALAKLDPSKEG